MKAFHLVGLKTDGSPAFSCTVRAASLADACEALRCVSRDPCLMTMEHATAFAAAKIFAGRDYVLVHYSFEGSFAAAVASCARQSVPGIDAAIVERSLRLCRRVFLGEAPASA